MRLLKVAMEAGEWTVSLRSPLLRTSADRGAVSQLCRELLRFLYSLDRTGLILRAALSEGKHCLCLTFVPTADHYAIRVGTATRPNPLRRERSPDIFFARTAC